MPKELRRWRPKDKSPLPSPSDRYLQMAAAMAWGMSWGEWQRESVVSLAEMIAHHLHSSMREGYTIEKAQSKNGGGGKDGMQHLTDLMNAMDRNRKK